MLAAYDRDGYTRFRLAQDQSRLSLMRYTQLCLVVLKQRVLVTEGSINIMFDIVVLHEALADIRIVIDIRKISGMPFMHLGVKIASPS